MSGGSQLPAAIRPDRWSPHLVPALFLGWTLGLGLLFALSGRILAAMRSEKAESWLNLLVGGQVRALPAAAVVLMAFFAARCVSLEGRSWGRTVLLHTAIAVVAIPGGTAVPYVLQHLSPGEPAPLANILLQNLPIWAVMYLMALGAAYGIRYFRSYRSQELRASRVQAQLAQARLDALDLQLRPHFLFNALNSVAALMHRDVAAADRVLTRLEDLLRITLQDSGEDEVPLRRELEVVRAYLDIEGVRFGDRLRVEWDLDERASDVLVPQLILQPLVENAVKHGIAPRRGPGLVRVVARIEGDALLLEVSDDGAGFSRPTSGAMPGTGVGLANLRARLEGLHPGRHEIITGPAEGRGARVRIRLPLRTSTPAAPV
jgi:two-component system, LytTR family, sensor kinase